MQYQTSHRRLGLLASTITAFALLLVFASGAKGLTAPTAAELTEGEGSAAEPAPSSEESAPTPSSESEPVAQSESAPPPASVDSSPTPISEVARVASTAQSTLAPAQSDPAASLTPRLPKPIASEPAGEIRQAVAETAGSAADAVKTAAQDLDRSNPIEPVHALAQRTLEGVSSTLQDAALRLAPPSIRQTPFAGAQRETSALPPLSGIPRLPVAGSAPLEQRIALDGAPGRPAEPGGGELLRLVTPSIAAKPAGIPGSPQTNASGPSFDRLSRHSENGAPPGGNGPPLLPELPRALTAASGAGSSLVPIAALLALLALAAPAILRGLTEVPGFRAPAPFVCALERPG